MLDLFNSQWTSPSLWAAGSITLAALIGSIHCVGMCGPLQTALLQGKKSATLLHQLGRLMGYVWIGVLFHQLGSLLEDRSFAFLQRAALSLYLLFLVAFTLNVFGLGSKWVSPRLKTKLMKPRLWFNKTQSFLPERLFYFIAGFLTFLLPCGWLYAFALLASTSPSQGWAAVMMAVFALGTAPALITTQWSWLRLRRNPLLTRLLAVVVLVFGVLSLSHRLQSTALQNEQPIQHGMSCH